jgi:hypothetical protein
MSVPHDTGKRYIESFGYLNRLKAWLCVFFTPRLIGYFYFPYTQLNQLIDCLLESVFLR